MNVSDCHKVCVCVCVCVGQAGVIFPTLLILANASLQRASINIALLKANFT